MQISNVGSVGIFMKNGGLGEVLGAAFGGVESKLRGKNFPQNVRALRMLPEKMLREVIQGPSNHEELFRGYNKVMAGLNDKACPCYDVVYRAEWEAEWLLAREQFEQN